jgi:hypothetical protein
VIAHTRIADFPPDAPAPPILPPQDGFLFLDLSQPAAVAAIIEKAASAT